MRENEAWMISASVRTASVLARPGHALEQDVSPGEQAHQEPLHHGVLPHDAARDFLEDGLHGKRLNRSVGQLRGAHAAGLLRVICGKDNGRRRDPFTAWPAARMFHDSSGVQPNRLVERRLFPAA